MATKTEANKPHLSSPRRVQFVWQELQVLPNTPVLHPILPRSWTFPSSLASRIGSPYVAQAGLKLLGSSDPPVLASQSGKHFIDNSCAIFHSMVSRKAWSDPNGHSPTLSSSSFRLKSSAVDEKTKTQKKAWIELHAKNIGLVRLSLHPLPAPTTTASKFGRLIPDKGLALSPRLECSGVITVHCSLDIPGISQPLASASCAVLELLGSSDPPTLVSQSVGILGMRHHAQPRILTLASQEVV
ncbi:Protein PPP5D1 [Plecturocebus cupreus]